MSTQSSAAGTDPFGRFVGSLIAAAFGLVFIVANTGQLPAAWSAAVRVAGVVIAVVLAVASLLQFRASVARVAAHGGAPSRRRWQSFNRGYWAVVAAEVVALFGGLAVINGVFDAPRFAVAWVAVVVGVHFFGLAAIWRLPLFHVLGAALVVFGVAGFVAGALGGSMAAIGVISGVTSGVALYLMVVAALRYS